MIFITSMQFVDKDSLLWTPQNKVSGPVSFEMSASEGRI